MTPTDAIAGAAIGEPEAVKALYFGFETDIRGHFTRRMQPADCDDLMQETFLAIPMIAKAWQKKAEPPQRFAEYLRARTALIARKLRHPWWCGYSIREDALEILAPFPTYEEVQADQLMRKRAERLLRLAPHNDVVADHFGLAGNGQLTYLQLALKYKISSDSIGSMIRDSISYLVKMHGTEVVQTLKKFGEQTRKKPATSTPRAGAARMSLQERRRIAAAQAAEMFAKD